MIGFTARTSQCSTEPGPVVSTPSFNQESPPIAVDGGFIMGPLGTNHKLTCYTNIFLWRSLPMNRSISRVCIFGLVGLLSCTGDTAPLSPTQSITEDTGITDTDVVTEPTTMVIDPSDDRLHYIGRWTMDDPARPTAGWQGASVSFIIDGTDVNVTLDPGTATEYFRVIIDNDHLGSRRFAAAPGVATYTLAQGLEPGAHTIELVKETYMGTSWTLHQFEFTGVELLAPPPTASRHIEFYGDSNLAGYALMSEENEADPEFFGCHFTYAGVTARAFGADYHNVSVSGETLTGMTGLYDRATYFDTTPTWDFSRYTPDVIVMNLGANDIYWGGENAIRGRYVDMLDRLRAAHPEAHIVVYNGWGWDFDEPANYTADVVADYGDPNVSIATFPWVFEQWHGAEYDHGGMARYLIAHLEKTLGWTATEPHLMSGYGWDGDVANGGFEEVAPFGGYGWRYSTSAGVDRVTNATDAFEGNAFLRLSDTGRVHQPNPATNGQTVTVTLWARGATEGDILRMTIDFRNQKMWSSPLSGDIHVAEIGTDWTQVTFAVDAPVTTNDPIFHTRLTLIAGAGSTVDIDGITMTTN